MSHRSRVVVVVVSRLSPVMTCALRHSKGLVKHMHPLKRHAHDDGDPARPQQVWCIGTVVVPLPGEKDLFSETICSRCKSAAYKVIVVVIFARSLLTSSLPAPTFCALFVYPYDMQLTHWELFRVFVCQKNFNLREDSFTGSDFILNINNMLCSMVISNFGYLFFSPNNYLVN